MNLPLPLLITLVSVGSIFVLSISAAILIYAIKSRPAPDWATMCLASEDRLDRLISLLENLVVNRGTPDIDDPRITWTHPLEEVGASG
jgi:hypothetical protein